MKFTNLLIRSSLPSWNRIYIAAGLYVLIACIASLIRLSRADFNVFPLLKPLDFYGTSPNFFVVLAGPLFSFFQNKEIDVAYYIKVALGTAVGLSMYEGLQWFLPNRTLDLYDILAAFLGAFCSILMAGILFFRGDAGRVNISGEPLRKE